MELFKFLMDEPYERRMVARHEDGELLISTAAVNDGYRPYETAIREPHYKDGRLIVVEAYATRREAEEGHARWLAAMTATPPPPHLIESGNCDLSTLSGTAGTIYPREEE